MLWLFEQIEELDDDFLMRLLPRISSKRRERVLRLRDKSARVQSIAAELLLRYAIRQEYGIVELPVISSDENGKPFFPAIPGICFNLSHCKTATACGVDATPLGVDVQEIDCLRDAKSNEFLQRKRACVSMPFSAWKEKEETIQSLLWVLHGAERDWVLSGEAPAERERRFITVWTYKEAFGKMTGAGILYDLERYNFLPCMEGGVGYDTCFQSFQRKNAVLTACTQSPLELRIVSIRELFSSAPPAP